MTTSTKSKFNLVETAKFLGIIIASLGTSTIVTSSAAESNEVKIAILETQMDAIEKDLPRMIAVLSDIQRSQDSIKIELRHMVQK